MTARGAEHGLVADVEVLKAEVTHCANRLDEHREAAQAILTRLDSIEKEKLTFRIAMANELGEIKTTLATEFGRLKETMAVQDERYKPLVQKEAGLSGAKWGGGIAAALYGVGLAVKEIFMK